MKRIKIFLPSSWSETAASFLPGRGMLCLSLLLTVSSIFTVDGVIREQHCVVSKPHESDCMYRKYAYLAASQAAANTLLIHYNACSWWMIYKHNDSKLLQPRWRERACVMAACAWSTVRMRCYVMKYGFRRRRMVWKGVLSLMIYLIHPLQVVFLSLFFKVKTSRWHRLSLSLEFCKVVR